MRVELTEAFSEKVVSGNCVSNEHNSKEVESVVAMVVFLFLEMECSLEEGFFMAAIVR